MGVAQRSYGYPILGDVQGPLGWGLGQLDLLSDKPVHSRGLELDVL